MDVEIRRLAAICGQVGRSVGVLAPTTCSKKLNIALVPKHKFGEVDYFDADFGIDWRALQAREHSFVSINQARSVW